MKCIPGDLAPLAVSAAGHIGIDAEVVQPDVDVENLSLLFFAPEVAATILALPSDQRLATFFNCWCPRKLSSRPSAVAIESADSFRSTRPQRCVGETPLGNGKIPKTGV